jgi:hypothetical protein
MTGEFPITKNVALAHKEKIAYKDYVLFLFINSYEIGEFCSDIRLLTLLLHTCGERTWQRHVNSLFSKVSVSF